ncbi:MAG TPA: ABC transporter ATP-binding protein [Dehalococcoidia bacterium]|nr:ABC transporter ATP-binding protein [Dehalococcoidia bacterium]
MSNDAHIVIEGVDMVYAASSRPLTALSSFDLTLRRGEFVSIIGPSGCGKSTLLRIVGGLQSPTRGRVLIDGRPPREAQREKQIGFVFQDPTLLPWRNVIENVRLPLQVNKRPRGAAGRPFSARPEHRPELVEGVLVGRADADDTSLGGRRGSPRTADPDALVDLVGLEPFRRYYPHQLSGGMQQRVAIARSLVTSPQLLLMDEPFGALDEITRTSMRFELLRVWRSTAEGACTVIFVTHSIAEAVLLADRVIVMTPQPGRIAADIAIDLPRPRPEEIELEPRFLEYTKRLRDLLRQGAPSVRPELVEGREGSVR